MLVSGVRSDKIGKNAVGRFSISPLVLKIFAFKVEELLIWRQPFWYANEGDMTSQLREWKLRKYHFCYKFWNIERNSKKLHRLLGVINPMHFNDINVLDCKSPSGLYFSIFEIDSTWPIIAVSAIRFKGLYCFFGCYGNSIVYLFSLLLRNSIIPENLKLVCSWFYEL